MSKIIYNVINGCVSGGANIGNVNQTVSNVPSNKKSRNPLKILFLSAGPIALERFDSETEFRAIEEAISKTKKRNNIERHYHQGVRAMDIIPHLVKFRPNILHFSGHGTEEAIFLRGDVDCPTEIEAKVLASILEERGVDTLVMNCCSSASYIHDLTSSVQTVIGVDGSLKDQHAKRFSEAFYASLGNGSDVKGAFRDGRDTVRLYGAPASFKLKTKTDDQTP